MRQFRSARIAGYPHWRENIRGEYHAIRSDIASRWTQELGCSGSIVERAMLFDLEELLTMLSHYDELLGYAHGQLEKLGHAPITSEYDYNLKILGMEF